MHTYVIKSNDISICNLKEFECIQELRATHVFVLQVLDSRFNNLRFVLGILNLESQNVNKIYVPILFVFNKILGKAFRETCQSRILNPVVKCVRVLEQLEHF